MKKYNVLPWSFVIALAAMLEQTVTRQVPFESVNANAPGIQKYAATQADEGKTIFTRQVTTTKDGRGGFTAQRLDEINNVLAKYE
jgi:hypothetical protein